MSAAQRRKLNDQIQKENQGSQEDHNQCLELCKEERCSRRFLLTREASCKVNPLSLAKKVEVVVKCPVPRCTKSYRYPKALSSHLQLKHGSTFSCDTAVEAADKEFREKVNRERTLTSWSASSLTPVIGPASGANPPPAADPTDSTPTTRSHGDCVEMITDLDFSEDNVEKEEIEHQPDEADITKDPMIESEEETLESDEVEESNEIEESDEDGDEDEGEDETISGPHHVLLFDIESNGTSSTHEIVQLAFYDLISGRSFSRSLPHNKKKFLLVSPFGKFAISSLCLWLEAERGNLEKKK